MRSKNQSPELPDLTDILEMLTAFQKGDFSKTLPFGDDARIHPLISKMNETAIAFQAQAKAANDATFIFDSLDIGIWKWDLITNSLEWDKNMYRIYGCDPDDFNGAYDAWEKSLSEETKARVVEEIRMAAAGGKNFDTNFQVVHKKSGKIQEIRSRAFVIRDSAGKPLKMWGINFDRAREAELELEFKSALKSLEAATKFLEKTGEMAKVGGWELDLNSGQVYMTRQTQVIHEIDDCYVPPKYSTGGEWYPPEAWPTVQSAVQAAIEHGESYDLEVPFITAKGRRIWVRVQGFPIKEDGKVKLLRGTFQDITKQKIDEEELAKMNLKLVQSSKLASLGEMSAGIAHEINNPLAIISGSAGLLLTFAGDPVKLASKVEAIKKSCVRISRIVSSLKKFSRTDDKKNFQINELSKIVGEAIILTQAKSHRHTAPVTLDCRTRALVLCDEVEIEQVLVNLINNAIDAIAEKQEKWVKLTLFEDAGSVVLRVSDSGTGIPEAVCNKIFQPFFTTKKIGEGTGLGLSVAKGILDEHKATITVLNDSLHTCFEIRFPMADSINTLI